MNFLGLKPLTADLLPAALELDRLCFGGLWTIDGYQRELASPNSDLLGLSIAEVAEGQEEKGEGRPELGEERREKGDRSWEKGEGKSHLLNPPSSPAPQLPSSPAPPSLVGIGCLWAILEEAHITLLGIHPAYRGQGWGGAILYALLTAAANRHLEWATLEVRASNHLAIALYQKFGFREAGRRRRYYQDTNEDALILWRSGLQTPEFGQMMAIIERQISDRLASGGWRISQIEESG